MAKAAKHQGSVTDTGAELVVLGPGVALAKHIWDAWKEGKPLVKPSDPLIFAVSESVTDDKRHTLTVFCENLSTHGVYVDSVSLSDPKPDQKGAPATAHLVPSKGTVFEDNSQAATFGESRTAPALRPLPVLVPSGEKACFEIAVPLLSERIAKKKPYGELTVRYTVLGVADNGLEKAVEFSVRPKK